MKKFLCLCAAFLFTLTTLQAEENLSSFSVEKLYVTPGSIYVAPDAIYLFMNDAFLPVENLSTDEGGVFAILRSDIRIGYCPKCGNSYSGNLRDHMPSCPANRR